jgi:hypothetical protein
MPPEEPCFNVLVGALSPPAPVDTLPAVTEHVEKGGGGGRFRRCGLSDPRRQDYTDTAYPGAGGDNGLAKMWNRR